MKEWICEEVPAVTIDGKVISTMLRQEQELVRCNDCRNAKWADPDDETVFCRLQEMAHNWDFFCADGKRQQ